MNVLTQTYCRQCNTYEIEISTDQNKDQGNKADICEEGEHLKKNLDGSILNEKKCTIEL